MPLRLYGDKVATCTMRVQVVLEELGLPYDLVEVSLAKGEHKTPEHLERQPFGKVPALDDMGLVLFESRSIVRYLASGTRLAGAHSRGAAAIVDNWAEVEAQNYGPAIGAIVYEKVFKPWMFDAEPDEAVVAKNMEALERVLDVYEKRLEGAEWLGGAELSIADLSHLPYTVYLIEKGGVVEPFQSRPRVWKWLSALRELPSWKRVWSGAFEA